MNRKIKKAVLPVAGFGTRLLPATKAMPKELLPIVDKPLIQYAVEASIAAVIDTLIFVTGRNKRVIEDHFDVNKELELALRLKGKNEQADMVRNIVPPHEGCIFVHQPDQLGLGHGVKGVAEKPRQEKAPYNLASIGRYIFNSDIFDLLRALPIGSGREIQLSDALNLQAQDGLVEAIKLKAKRFDCGSIDGYMSAVAHEYSKRFEN